MLRGLFSRLRLRQISRNLEQCLHAIQQKPDGTYEPLAQKNVDTGMGLERTVCVLNGLDSVYQTDVFAPAVEEIERLSGKNAAKTRKPRVQSE